MPTNHPLTPALRPSQAEDLEWLSGALVVAVDTAGDPHTLTLRLADGAEVDDVPFLGWWEPAVDARVEVLRRGQTLLALGPIAPAALSTAAPSTPPTPPPAPAAPPARVTRYVQPVNYGTWDGVGSYWSAYVQQGGERGKRALWVYGGGIAAAKGSGTVVAGTIYVGREATAHGVPGAANVRLGGHGYSALPGGAPSALAHVATVGTLTPGQGATFALTSSQVAAINAGTLAGFGLEPGAASYSSPDYLKGVAGAPAGSLALVIE